MPKLPLSALLITLLAFGGASALAQDPQPRAGTPELAAAQGLAILQAMANDKAKNTGFASRTEAARATLGAPLKVFVVELKALAAFKPGNSPDVLLRSSPAAFYPVVLDGAVRSSVRVEDRGKGWEPARVGNTGLATAVARARSALSLSGGSETALVQVLALNLVFVAQKGSDGWLLAPVVDDPSVDLRVGKAELAQSVFVRLAPLAALQSGDPT
jgi:hypothetical protein